MAVVSTSSTDEMGSGFDKPVLSHDEGLNRRAMGPWFRRAQPTAQRRGSTDVRGRGFDKLNRRGERTAQPGGMAVVSTSLS